MVLESTKKVAIVADPVEKHILSQLEKLRQQNQRMRDSVSKTARWSTLKNAEEWKPFDFYHYFCHLYQEKYGIIYRLHGNIVRAYQCIEKFLDDYSISKVDYKAFIDLAFSRYFNAHIIPCVNNLCSQSLYTHLMGVHPVKITLQYLQDLDAKLAEESKVFENIVNEMREQGEIS